MNAIPTIGSTQLQRATSRVLKRVFVGKERLVIERGGFPVAVLVPYQDFEELMRLVEAQSSERAKPVKRKRVKLSQ